jgi:hypothetical protein
MSNCIGATIIDREEDITDVKLRLKVASARNQTNRVGFNMRFGSDQLYRGIHRRWPSTALSVEGGQIEILFDFMIANSGGIDLASTTLSKEVIAADDPHAIGGLTRWRATIRCSSTRSLKSSFRWRKRTTNTNCSILNIDDT